MRSSVRRPIQFVWWRSPVHSRRPPWLPGARPSRELSISSAAPAPGNAEGGSKRRRPRVLILGSGWAGFTLARRLSKSLFDVRVVSPANHFLFTPLLPSTAVGTLEFRAIQEPVRTIEGLGDYYQAKAKAMDFERGLVTCEDLYKGVRFDVRYDYLCIAGGMKSNTFNAFK